jgi:hypothetical protein
MATLPPIPDKPTDRPETWAEYRARRSAIALHRMLLDNLSAWVKKNPHLVRDAAAASEVSRSISPLHSGANHTLGAPLEGQPSTQTGH